MNVIESQEPGLACCLMNVRTGTKYVRDLCVTIRLQLSEKVSHMADLADSQRSVSPEQQGSVAA